MSPTLQEHIKTSDFIDVKGRLIGYDPQRFWRKLNRGWNFLKHGNDSREHLSFQIIDNIRILELACSAYRGLNLAPSVEMQTYATYLASIQEEEFSAPADEMKKVRILRQYSDPERKEICWAAIGDANLFVRTTLDAEP